MFVSGNGINARNTTLNGVTYNFAATKQVDGTWLIEAAGDGGRQTPPTVQQPDPVVEQPDGTEVVIPTLNATTAAPLAETTLHEGITTLTLSGRTYESSSWGIKRALTVSGIDGVIIDSVTRISDTQVKVKLEFSGNISSDSTLIFTLGANGIAEYTGNALTAIVPVTAIQESLVASTGSPLTETTLHERVVTLTLSGRTYGRSWDIDDAVTVSGIDGVTVESRDIDRISDTEVTVELTFNGNIDTDATLTFTLGADGIAEYTGNALTAIVPVTAIQESLVASTGSPLTETTLHERVVTLTLSGRTYGRSGDIDDAVTVSGIDGITVKSWDIDRINDTEVTVELTFNGNIDTDATLTFTLGADGIAGYTGNALTATVPVTAIQESLVASTESPLTETTLHEGLRR